MWLVEPRGPNRHLPNPARVHDPMSNGHSFLPNARHAAYQGFNSALPLSSSSPRPLYYSILPSTKVCALGSAQRHHVNVLSVDPLVVPQTRQIYEDKCSSIAPEQSPHPSNVHEQDRLLTSSPLSMSPLRQAFRTS